MIVLLNMSWLVAVTERPECGRSCFNISPFAEAWIFWALWLHIKMNVQNAFFLSNEEFHHNLLFVMQDVLRLHFNHLVQLFHLSECYGTVYWISGVVVVFIIQSIVIILQATKTSLLCLFSYLKHICSCSIKKNSAFHVFMCCFNDGVMA